MPDVFISYSRQDLESVSRLANAITDAGYEVWWDAELPPHKSYSDVIEEKVETSKAAIVVWSPTARQSQWVRAEAEMARNQGKLIQTALGDIMPPLPFNQIQFADLGDWNGEPDHNGWLKVLESLRELCGERETSGSGTSAAAAGGAAAVAATPARPATPSEPAPAPTPAPAPEPAPVPPPQQAAPAGAPPGSLEYHRKEGSKAPLILAGVMGGVGVLAAGLVGAASFFGGFGDYDTDTPSIAQTEPLDLSFDDGASTDPVAIDEGPDLTPPVIDEPEPQPTFAPQQSEPTFPTGQRSFSGAINTGASRTHSVGLNAGTSYMIVAACDQDCTDIDMWLYDENGNLIDEDVLDDDYPVLEVSPVRSATFQIRLQMFACSIEPCGYEITVQPL